MEPGQLDKAEETLKKALFNEMISVDQLKTIIDAGLPDVVVLDLRTEVEHKGGVIPSSQVYPCDHNLVDRQDTSIFAHSFDETFDSKTFSENMRYILVCRSGPRTEIAVEIFLENELQACELVGGLIEWSRQGYELTAGESASRYVG